MFKCENIKFMTFQFSSAAAARRHQLLLEPLDRPEPSVGPGLPKSNFSQRAAGPAA